MQQMYRIKISAASIASRSPVK